MKQLIKIFVILIICTASIGLQSKNTSAKEENGVKLTLINKQVNTDTSEAIVAIKNKKNSRISISKVSIQRKDENWVEMKRQKLKCKIAANKKKYVDVGVRGIPSGDYRMVFRVKRGKKNKQKIISFTVEKSMRRTSVLEETTTNSPKPEETTISITNPEEPTTNEPVTSKPDDVQEPSQEIPTPGIPSNTVPNKTPVYQLPAGTVTKNSTVVTRNSIKQILLNKDFRISEKGKVEAVVFSETDYKTAYKTKIYLNIQRKSKRGFKTYKKYKQVKKSNIAYMNKTLQVKKQGKYRMYVRIISYTREGEKSVRNYRSKTVRYAG